MGDIDRIHWIPAIHRADRDSSCARRILRDADKAAIVSGLVRSIDGRRDIRPRLFGRGIFLDDAVVDHIRPWQIVEGDIQIAVRIDQGALRRRRFGAGIHGEGPRDRLSGQRRPCFAIVGAHIHRRSGVSAHVNRAGIAFIEEHPLHAIVVGRSLDRETGHLRPRLRAVFAHPQPVLPRTHHELVRLERIHGKPLPGRASVAVGAHLERRVVRAEGRASIPRHQECAAIRIRIHSCRDIKPVRISRVERNALRTVEVVLIRRMEIRQRRPGAVPGIPSIHAANVGARVNQSGLRGVRNQTGNIPSGNDRHRLERVRFGPALRHKLRSHWGQKQEEGKAQVDPAKTRRVDTEKTQHGGSLLFWG